MVPIVPKVTVPPGVDIELLQFGKLALPMGDMSVAPGFSTQYVATSIAQPLTTGKA